MFTRNSIISQKTSNLIGIAAKVSFSTNSAFIRDFDTAKLVQCRSQWPRGLRRGFAAARFLGLWVRIPSGHESLSLVSVVCCQVEVSALGWSRVQRSPTECGVSECDHEASEMRRPWPTGGCCAIVK